MLKLYPRVGGGEPMRYLTTWLCGIPVALACVAPAAAQEDRHVDIELQARVVHDTNVARSNEATAAARGIDPEDTIFSPGVRVDILLPASRQSFFLRGSAGRDYYEENDVLDSTRYDLLGGLNLDVGPCDGVLMAGYQRHQSDLQDLSLVATQNIESLTSGILDATCGREVGLAPTVRLSTTKADNSAPSLVTSDYRNRSATVGLAYRRPSFGQVSVYARHDESEYPNRLIVSGPTTVQDGYELDAVGVRYIRRLGARIEGEVSAAQTKINPEAPGVPDFEGMTYGAEVGFRATSRLRTRLRLDRQANPTIRPGAAYAIDETIQLDATYQLGARLTVDAGVLSGTSRYRGAGLSGGTDLTKEDLTALFGAVRWDVGRRVALALDARHEERETNIAAFDYDSTRVGLTAIGKF
jgi:hypothetical protein